MVAFGFLLSGGAFLWVLLLWRDLLFGGYADIIVFACPRLLSYCLGYYSFVDYCVSGWLLASLRDFFCAFFV